MGENQVEAIIEDAAEEVIELPVEPVAQAGDEEVVPDVVANLGEGLRNLLYAGIGAVALGGEAAKDLIDRLVAKGEISADEGKNLSEGFVSKAASTVGAARDAALEARMGLMTQEEREAFAAKAAELVAKLAERDAEKAQVDESVPAEAVDAELEAVPEEGTEQ